MFRSVPDLQIGHVECASSHGSMHSTWYRCSRTVSPAWNAPRHTEHVAAASSQPVPVTLCRTDRLYVNDGRPAVGLARRGRSLLRSRPRRWCCSSFQSSHAAAGSTGGAGARGRRARAAFAAAASAAALARLLRYPWQRLHTKVSTSRKAPAEMATPAMTPPGDAGLLSLDDIGGVT